MTTEELLKPRWKVIADYPDSPFDVGEIINSNGTVEQFERVVDYTLISNCTIEYPDDYPAIFKKLKWWEEREFNELPKYVKNKDGVYETFFRTPSKDGSLWEWQVVHPTKEYGAEVMYILDNQMLPSTKEEYELQTLNN